MESKDTTSENVTSNPYWQVGYKAGIREMVEWIEGRIHYEQGYDWGSREGAPIYIAEIDPIDLIRLKDKCKPN